MFALLIEHLNNMTTIRDEYTVFVLQRLQWISSIMSTTSRQFGDKQYIFIGYVEGD